MKSLMETRDNGRRCERDIKYSGHFIFRNGKCMNWSAAEMLNSVLTKAIIVDRLGYPSMTAHYLKVRVNY